VRVPEEVLKCVGFVGEVAYIDPITQEISGDLFGTGFFVAVRPEHPRLRKTSMSIVFFVTAKHLVEDMAKKQVPAYFRVNKTGGGSMTLTPHAGTVWYLHPTDKTADVAVIPIGYKPGVDIRAVALEQFATSDVLQRMDIGIGNEVFATGLFQPPGGGDHGQPIVRHGNIAMMPTEQIETEYGYADVYLVEARSIGGLSGSPVFVRPTICLPLPENATGLKYAFCNGHGATLLGLMHGHWSIKESELNSPVINQQKTKGVNLGVGIVVPAMKILETIQRPEIGEFRRQIEESTLQKGIPGMDSAKQEPKQEPEKELFTKEQFEAALRKATRKTK